ncbi:5-hydroxytryptamine receptor 1D-like [Anopheles albimanus]|uniref:G-protein coupled receptors family 1 profile domain-containing protein n=1 Tax=Anopheles albimanus TaxID=7167 RepID=A0A8W7K645_ANOAL|nr:5-hydroxytryptamine receptor 1D-like [Anopheles albimanus]XP_035785224.1 5-hydroxytryptamine receptor 1D-like [Anopheles albimanus]
MDLKAGKHLVAPAINNISCSHNRFAGHFLHQLGPFDVIQALFIVLLTFLVISANLMVIFVINSRRYAAYIHPQPRYLLTSLALNDLAIGLLIIPFSALPALLHCWPYGEIFCQIQALLRGALSQQSAVILVCMAVDRYLCVLHPRIYHKRSSKKGCVAVLSVTWILCLTCFGLLVLPKGYYFNKSGLLACEPFYSKSSYRILSSCALYFPTTMVLMYCYGSSFHANRYRLATPTGGGGGGSLSLNVSSSSCSNGGGGGVDGTTANGVSAGRVATADHRDTIETLAASTSVLDQHRDPCNDGNTLTGITTITPMSVSFSEKLVPDDDRRIHGSTSRTMAAISLGFIVIITPWTIQEIVATCTGSKIPPSIDFCVTWIALSSSFWNPFLYWLLNARFRRICKDLLTSKCTGSQSSLEEKCSISLEYDHQLTSLPPLPPGPPPATICRSAMHTPRPDIECSEKYWGDILERTYSTGSINTLHRMGGLVPLHFSSRQPSNRTLAHPQPQLSTQYHRCEQHPPQRLMRNQSSTSIDKERCGGSTGGCYKEDGLDLGVHFRDPSQGSETQVCERELHDINCAKNKAFFRGFNLHQGLPDI